MNIVDLFIYKRYNNSMRITKYLHSCLLIEEQNIFVLIDPGNYTYDAKVLDIDKLPKLDYLLITHEHPDHFHMSFIKEIIQKFPDVKIISNSSVVKILRKESVGASTEGDNFIKVKTQAHEKHWDREVPSNVMFEVFNKLTHPGDSLGFATTKEILALPLIGPSWMIAQAVEKVLAIKPKIIIPIHDYYLRDKVQIAMCSRLKSFLVEKGIEFKVMETGKELEV